MCNDERTVTLTVWEIVRDFHLVEDIAQDSFLIAFRKLHQLREELLTLDGLLDAGIDIKASVSRSSS